MSFVLSAFRFKLSRHFTQPFPLHIPLPVFWKTWCIIAAAIPTASHHRYCGEIVRRCRAGISEGVYPGNCGRSRGRYSFDIHQQRIDRLIGFVHARGSHR